MKDFITCTEKNLLNQKDPFIDYDEDVKVKALATLVVKQKSEDSTENCCCKSARFGDRRKEMLERHRYFDWWYCNFEEKEFTN